MPWVGLQYVIVVFPDHTHLRFGYATHRLVMVDMYAKLYEIGVTDALTMNSVLLPVSVRCCSMTVPTVAQLKLS